MKVIFFETFEAEAAAIKKYLPADVDARYTHQTFQSFSSTPDVDLISIRTQSVWSPYPNLKAVLSRSTGYDHLVDYKKHTSLHMGYLPEYCSYAVAEHAVLLLLMLLRKMKFQQQQFQSFNRENLTGREMRGKHALICGVGNIGYEIYQLCSRMGMVCYGYDICQRHKEVQYVELERGVTEADVVFCSLPANSSTVGVLNYQILNLGKSNKVVVNISRGEVTPVLDLGRLLKEGRIAGVGLDVFEHEPLLAEALRNKESNLTQAHQCLMDLQAHYPVICTPHNAFNTEEALDRKARFTVDSIRHFQTSGSFPHEVPS